MEEVMSPRAARLWLRVSLVVALTVVPAEVLLYRALVSPTLADRAAVWAESVSSSPARQSDAMQYFENLPTAYRLSLYRTLTVDRKRAVWERVFSRYALDHPEMTPEQSLCIELARQIIESPEFEAGVGVSPADLSTVKEQAIQVFQREDVITLFYALGPANTRVGELKEPLAERLVGWLVDRIIVHAGGDGGWVDQCSCHVGAWLTHCDLMNGEGGGPYLFRCEAEPCAGPEECGFMLEESCDGGCWAERMTRP